MSIIIENLTKYYGEQPVLQGFSAQIPDGGAAVFMGKSGCGKTTLLRILADLEAYDTGAVRGLEGKKISMVFQEDRLIEHYTALENVVFAQKFSLRENRLRRRIFFRFHQKFSLRENRLRRPMPFGFDQKEKTGSAERLLTALGLGDALHKKAGELSGGMKRRTAIARALAVPYDILLLDEAFKGLDEKTKMKTMEICQQETIGKTLVMTTHDPRETEFFQGVVCWLS